MKELSIEIPLGAKDSELKSWEYTIPEGMEAEIKDGKIIVREKESEDERIKKIISDILLIDSDEIREILDANNVLMQDVYAWLEKKDTNISSFPKEQQVFMKKYASLDKITLIKLLAERDANNAESIKSFEKQGKQKQDVNMQINPSEYINDMGGNGCYLKNTTQTSTWSEEDEKEVAVLEAYIRSKDWSEKYVDRALGIVDELVNKIKSLKSQSHWKPSEEQMKLLREVQQALLGKDCHNRFVNFMYELKRLREE